MGGRGRGVEGGIPKSVGSSREKQENILQHTVVYTKAGNLNGRVQKLGGQDQVWEVGSSDSPAVPPS